MSSLIYHPAVMAAKRARIEALQRRIIPPDWIEAAIRVEVTQMVMGQLWNLARFMPLIDWNADGPVMIEGVPYYEVRQLPSPGWRVLGLPI